MHVTGDSFSLIHQDQLRFFFAGEPPKSKRVALDGITEDICCDTCLYVSNCQAVAIDINSFANEVDRPSVQACLVDCSVELNGTVQTSYLRVSESDLRIVDVSVFGGCIRGSAAQD